METLSSGAVNCYCQGFWDYGYIKVGLIIPGCKGSKIYFSASKNAEM